MELEKLRLNFFRGGEGGRGGGGEGEGGEGGGAWEMEEVGVAWGVADMLTSKTIS